MNRREHRPKLGDVAATLRGLDGSPINAAMRREILAAHIKQLHPTAASAVPPLAPPAASPVASAQEPDVAPRVRETLQRLLSGDSEKQIAARLGISRHTVHVYVKRLYRHYDVNSRGELLARFVTRQ